jgi:hypothetical protein
MTVNKLILAGAALAALAVPAAAQAAATPVAPADGTQFKDPVEITLKWALAPGEDARRVEWSKSPATHPDGAFVSPIKDEDGYDFDGDATSYELYVGGYGTYYWHVQTSTLPACPYPEFRFTSDCPKAVDTWGPMSSFSVLKPPPAPKHKPSRLTGKQLKQRVAQRKAAKAVLRELRFDYGDKRQFGVSCVQYRGGRFTCSLSTLEWNGRFNEYVQGKARVQKIGKRYLVDYRIYW